MIYFLSVCAVKLTTTRTTKMTKLGKDCPKSKLFIYKKWHKAFCGIVKDEKE